MKKICALVIWYNPDSLSVENILKYHKFFDKVYIIDNSIISNNHLANKIINSYYFPNYKNLGIAKALNQGCLKAFTDNFEWCMTMDQDSTWDTNELSNYLNNIASIKDESIKSFAPLHSNEIKSLIGKIHDKKKIQNCDTYKFQHRVMTSGNIINLNSWNELKGFKEILFIDEVDHEYCYNLLEHDYKIIEFQNISMRHTLGISKKTILPRFCKHSGVRLFYIFRNMLYIKDIYPERYNEFIYPKYLIYTIIQKILEFKIKDLKFIKQGIKAYKNNIYGSYNDFLENIK